MRQVKGRADSTDEEIATNGISKRQQMRTNTLEEGEAKKRHRPLEKAVEYHATASINFMHDTRAIVTLTDI